MFAAYECITFSDFWDDLEDRFNFAHKTCDQLRNVICELQMCEYILDYTSVSWLVLLEYTLV